MQGAGDISRLGTATEVGYLLVNNQKCQCLSLLPFTVISEKTFCLEFVCRRGMMRREATARGGFGHHIWE